MFVDQKLIIAYMRQTLIAIQKAILYLSNLQWTEKKQHKCLFCDVSNFSNIVYEVNAMSV